MSLNLCGDQNMINMSSLTDPSDIQNVMSVFNAKYGITLQESPRNF